jgi:two-component system, sensor histidine kinase FlrB
MVPGSNLEPINRLLEDASDESELRARSAAFLAGAFSEFITASSRLESSYRRLQQEVHELRQELSARDAALNISLAENDRIRLDLQQIVDSMPCGVLVLSRQGEILMINPECGRLLGIDGVQFPDGAQATLQQICAFSGINLESSFEHSDRTNAGQEFCIHGATGKRWLEVCHRPLLYPAGGPDRVILILRDVTAQRRAELERESARKAMALAEIATILAHEIRNPLASLELFAELVENDGQQRRQWISNLRAGIRTLSSTVNNVLTFHGSTTLQLSPMNLCTVIGDSLKFVQPLAQQAAVTLLWRKDCKQECVMGNEGALQQVVFNLASNAIRHTPPGGTVTVSLRCSPRDEPNPQVVVEFSDTGCGIRPDQMDRIFEPGFSGNGDTTGLGLAVCRRIMTQHGGWISVSKTARVGAQLLLSLPTFKSEEGDA